MSDQEIWIYGREWDGILKEVFDKMNELGDLISQIKYLQNTLIEIERAEKNENEKHRDDLLREIQPNKMAIGDLDSSWCIKINNRFYGIEKGMYPLRGGSAKGWQPIKDAIQKKINELGFKYLDSRIFTNLCTNKSVAHRKENLKKELNMIIQGTYNNIIGHSPERKKLINKIKTEVEGLQEYESVIPIEKKEMKRKRRKKDLISWVPKCSVEKQIQLFTALESEFMILNDDIRELLINISSKNTSMTFEPLTKIKTLDAPEPSNNSKILWNPDKVERYQICHFFHQLKTKMQITNRHLFALIGDICLEHGKGAIPTDNLSSNYSHALDAKKGSRAHSKLLLIQNIIEKALKVDLTSQ